MFRKLGIHSLTLATLLAVAAPVATLARDRDERREHGYERGYRRDYERHEVYRGREERVWRDRDRGHFSIGVNVYSAPARVIVPPPENGYYDQYGVWHAYGYYDQYGVWHAYGQYDPYGYP